MRRMVALVAVALTVSACAATAKTSGPTLPTPPAAGYQLWVRAGAGGGVQQLALIDLKQGGVVRTVPQGAFAPDGSRLYIVDSNPSGLRALDPISGSSRGSVSLPAGFGFPTGTFNGPSPLSPNGAWYALQSLDRDASGYVTRSHYLVGDTAFTRKPQRIDLNGEWDFDALNNDGTRLYLLQVAVGSANGYRYHVRLYDVAAHQLNPGIVFDKRDGGALMQGSRLTGTPSPDGQWLYSLYAFGNMGSPFIHMLNLTQPFAWCVDLPGGDGDGEKQLLWSLTMTPDGNRLYAVNGGLGIIAEVGPGSGGPPAIVRTAHFHVTDSPASSFFGLVVNAEAKRILYGGAALSADGRTLYAIGEDGLYVIDTARLTLRDHLLAGMPFDSVMLSPDGADLFAVSSAQAKLVQLQVADGAVREIPVNTDAFAVERAQPIS